MITGDRLIRRTTVLVLLYAVFMCAAPTVTQAQFAGGNITGTARGDSGSPMPGVHVSMKDVTTARLGPRSPIPQALTACLHYLLATMN